MHPFLFEKLYKENQDVFYVLKNSTWTDDGLHNG